MFIYVHKWSLFIDGVENILILWLLRDVGARPLHPSSKNHTDVLS